MLTRIDNNYVQSNYRDKRLVMKIKDITSFLERLSNYFYNYEEKYTCL